jgi:hypothetical protein
MPIWPYIRFFVNIYCAANKGASGLQKGRLPWLTRVAELRRSFQREAPAAEIIHFSMETTIRKHLISYSYTAEVPDRVRSTPPATQVGGNQWPEMGDPAADGFVRDDDPALREQVFDIRKLRANRR